MKWNKKRKIIVAVAPVGKEIEAPSVNPLLPEDVAGEDVACAKAAKTNVELVERIVSLVEQIGYEVATIDEARKILKLG